MPPSRPATPIPFWQRLRPISLYPFRGPAGFTLIALTLCSLLSLIPVIGWVVTLLVWLGAYKYAFEILRSTADGHDESPEVMTDLTDGVVVRLLLLQIIIGLTVVLTAVLLGWPPALAVMALLIFLQPGCIISLAMDGSLRRALNPAVSLEVVQRVGWPYLAVFGLLFVIQVSALTAGSWLETVMPPVVSDLALNAVSFWGLFAAFHLMGYLVYQYHEDLGYSPDSHRDIGNGHPYRPDHDGALLDNASQHIREGNSDAALALIRDEMNSRAVSFDVHELYRRLLRQGDNRPALRDHTAQYLNLLLGEKNHRVALIVLRESLQDHPEDLLLALEHGEEMVALARDSGQHQLALDTSLSLLRTYPKSLSAPRRGLETALLLVERFGRDDEALALLEQAHSRCDDSHLLEKIEAAMMPLRPGGLVPAPVSS